MDTLGERLAQSGEASTFRGGDCEGSVLRCCGLALVGLLGGFGILFILTIGIVLLLAAAAVGAVALLRYRVTAGVAGLVASAAVPLAYVAWLNRDGPGEICASSAVQVTCTERWSPWPWFVGATLCLVGAVVLFGLLRNAAGDALG